MDSLYQRVKELDSDTFQRFCFQLLKERHPEQELRHVEGASGDEGLDVFAGELSGRPVIWQCKAFPNGVGKSQKNQIRRSLRTALTHFAPAYWILCLSVDLDSKTSRWFEKLKKSNERIVIIGQMFASDIVHELIHRKTLKDHFFPNASLNVTELRQLAANIGAITGEKVDRKVDINLEAAIEHWKKRDARFNYQIVFDRDLGPRTHVSTSIQPGLMLSIHKESGRTINVFARDLESLRADPPNFTTTFTGSGIQKFEKFVKTGETQEFETHELGAIKSNWPLMSDMTNSENTHKLVLAQSPVLLNMKRSVRVEFIGEDHARQVRYELLDLKPLRIGTEESEISISGKNAPFRLSLAIPNPPRGNAAINIEYDWVHREPKEIQKSLDAFNLLRPSGKISIFDLETEKILLEANVCLPDETPSSIRRRELVADATSIANHFGVNLKLPERIEREDFETAHFVKQFIEKGMVNLDTISMVVIKSKENEHLLSQQLGGGKGFFRFENIMQAAPILFRTPINIGPVVMETEAEINDLAETLLRFREAAIGAGVQISMKPLGSVRVSLLSAILKSEL